jgi:hypothetical protein
LGAAGLWAAVSFIRKRRAYKRFAPDVEAAYVVIMRRRERGVAAEWRKHFAALRRD